MPNNLLTTFADGSLGVLHDFQVRLQEWGFGELPITVTDAPICFAEDLYWLSESRIEKLPGSCLQAARVSLLSHGSTSKQRKSIFIRNSAGRSLVNQAEVEAVAEKNGFFLCDIHNRPASEISQLFRDTNFIIAAHGAALVTLIYCAKGTTVLELPPGSRFRPIFSQLSDKLNLTYAVLRCKKNEGSIGGTVHSSQEPSS